MNVLKAKKLQRYKELMPPSQLRSQMSPIDCAKWKWPLHYGPSLEKIPTSFSLLVKIFCFSLVFCENFQCLITFYEVSESVDGLQIRVNLANPKIKNSVVIIFDSNSSNFWGVIFQNPKNFLNIIFPSKVKAI